MNRNPGVTVAGGALGWTSDDTLSSKTVTILFLHTSQPEF